MSSPVAQPLPLQGVRILAIEQYGAGPFASMHLADLGAEVIKIERPGAGDDTRMWGPPFTTRADGSRGDAAYFLCANRGQKSVTVGMAVPDRLNLFRYQAMRGMGGNGRRFSHNPPAPALLALADRLGLLTLDENRVFALGLSPNMVDLVQRDRNHPSVIFWSFWCARTPPYKCPPRAHR